jgi:hypothetical protein
MAFTLEWLRTHGEVAKVWAECFAYVSGGAFLIYKVLSGYFLTDLSLKISCERFTLAGVDNLSVTATVKKGDKGAIRIHDARVRITDAVGTILHEKALIGTNRLSFNTDDSARMTATFHRDSKTPWLSLPPGDKTQFAAHFDVPLGIACLVEVVILGKKLWWGGKAAQWRASAVSFPMT